MFDKHESLMMHVLDSHLTKKDKPPSEAPSVLNNRDQNEVQPSEPTKVEEKAPVEKEAENLEIKSVEAESPAPTVVEPQEQPVEIPISDTKEKVVVRPKRFKKSEFVSGFDDLAQYEFSTPLFPLVAEVCSYLHLYLFTSFCSYRCCAPTILIFLMIVMVFMYFIARFVI